MAVTHDFALIAQENCRVLEVTDDDRVGKHREWISNTLVVRRP